MLVSVDGGVVQPADVSRIVGGREVLRSEVGVWERGGHMSTNWGLQGGEV